MLHNNFLLKGGYPVLNIIDGQLMVAFATDKILYSVDFGVSWSYYKNIPFNPVVNPIVGGSIGFNYGGSAGTGINIVNGIKTYTKSYLNATGVDGKLSTSFGVFDHYGASGVLLARGTGTPIFISGEASSHFGYPNYRYIDTNIAEYILWATSNVSASAALSDGLIISANKLSVWYGVYGSITHNFNFANGRVGKIEGYWAGGQMYGYVVDASNNVYYIDFAAGTSTYKGNVTGLNFGVSSPLKSGFDTGRSESGVGNGNQIVAANIISVSNNNGANWTSKLTLSGYATEALMSANGRHMVVSTNDGKLYVSNDFGSTFQLRYDNISTVFRNVSLYKRSEPIKLDMKTFLDY